MKIQKIKDTIKNLKDLEKNSSKKGYDGDATEYAFRRFVLELLLRNYPKKIKRRPTKWNSFVGEYLKEGKTIKEASIKWNSLKKGEEK